MPESATRRLRADRSRQTRDTPANATIGGSGGIHLANATPPRWGILLAGGTSPCAGRLVVASVAVSTHASERPKRWSHGGWFGMRLTGRCRWSQPPSSRNKLAYIRNVTITCIVAGKGPCMSLVGILKVVSQFIHDCKDIVTAKSKLVCKTLRRRTCQVDSSYPGIPDFASNSSCVVYSKLPRPPFFTTA